MKMVQNLLSAFFILGILTSCGQKGPLYLPQHKAFVASHE